MATKKSGEKFTEKYRVDSATIYKATKKTTTVRIPGPSHPLYDATAPTVFDPIRVEAIDRDGKMTTPIEVWTDPDDGVLWILDGRGRWLDVEEVNRRRAEQGRTLVTPHLTPFGGDEKAAIARVREKNYHRRMPTPSGMAMDLLALRNAGHSWEQCARILHVEITDPEQWGRRLVPLAFCLPEIRDAFDKGEINRNLAGRFGGSALDGSKALGRKEQLALFEQMTKKKEPKGWRAVPTWARQRAHEALQNGATEGLKNLDKLIAKAMAATMAWLEGDTSALNSYPAIEAIIVQATKPKTRGPKRKMGKA